MSKLNKKQAFEILQNAYNTDGRLTSNQFKQLLVYFSPPLPKKCKTMFQWVASACAKNDIREYLNYVIVIDGIMYGTCGGAIHQAPTPLSNGFYDPLSEVLIEANALYNKIPNNLKNLIELNTQGDVEGIFFSEQKEEHPPKYVKSPVTYTFEKTYHYDKNMVEKAIQSESSPEMFFYHRSNGIGGKTVIQGVEGRFFIMPRRV